MSMDISGTIEPKSDQQNYDDLVTGPRTVTVVEVKAGPADQPVHLHLAEFPGRPYKPNKTMRRVLAAVWGLDASAYVGRRLTLVGNPDVKWGGKKVGGIEIAAMSHMTEPRSLMLTYTRGQRREHVVRPLPDHIAPHLAAMTAAGTVEELIAAWNAAAAAGVTGNADVIALKDQRKAELGATP